MWEEKYVENVKKIKDELLVYSTRTSFIYSPASEILIRELMSLSNKNLRYNVVLKTLIHLKKTNRKSLESFEKVYETFLHDALRNEMIEWNVILPYQNIVLNAKFKILDDEFNIISYSKCKQVISEEKLLEKLKTKGYGADEFELSKKFIFIKVKASNIYSCWSKISAKFTLLQGIYDFGMLKGVWIETENSMTSFKHPDWIAIQNQKADFEFTTFRIFGTITKRPINLLKIKPTKDFLKYASKSADPHSTKKLIFNCLRLYAQAMEAVHKGSCFLNLWQLIENACISELIGGNTSDVVKRLAVIVKETKSFKIEPIGLFKSITGKRNDLVHNGIDNIEMHDINILKILSENALTWLIGKEKVLKTKLHVNEYFKLRTKNKKDREAIIETIKHLESL